MERFSTLSIVLRTVQYRERDKIVTALSESHGKVSALAKNSTHSRRFGASLDPFTAGTWQLSRRSGSDLFHLEAVDVRKDFQSLRSDFLRLSVASFWNEIILMLVPENEPLPSLFKLHANALSTLDQFPSDSFFPELSLYLGKFLQLNGTAPQLHSCLACGKSIDTIGIHEEVRLEGQAGGWSCTTCPRSGPHDGFHTLSAGVIRVFGAALDQPIRTGTAQLNPILSLGTGKSLFEFLESFCAFHLPGYESDQFKSLRFIKG